MANTIDPGTGGYPPPPPGSWTPNQPFQVVPWPTPPTYGDTVGTPPTYTYPVPEVVPPPPPPPPVPPTETLPPPPVPPVDQPPVDPGLPTLPPGTTLPPPPPELMGQMPAPNYGMGGASNAGPRSFARGPMAPAALSGRPQIPLWARGLQRSPYAQAAQARQPFAPSQFGRFDDQMSDEERAMMEAQAVLGVPAWAGGSGV